MGTVQTAQLERLRSAMRASLIDPNGSRAAWIRASADCYLALHPDEAKWRRTHAEDAIPSVDEIRDRAVVADRANRAIPPRGRVDSRPGRRDEWSAQVGWAEETLGEGLTDGFRAALAAVRAGDRSGLEYCLRFLEADPWCYGTGYAKAKIIPAIVQFELDEPTRERLARVVLRVVDDPRPRGEIKRYGTLGSAVALADLRARIEQRTAAADPQIRFNVRHVLARLIRAVFVDFGTKRSSPR